MNHAFGFETKVTIEKKPGVKMTDEEIDKIVKSQKFFQTQLFESDDDDDYMEPELADLSESRPESEVSAKTTKKKKTPKNDIIQSGVNFLFFYRIVYFIANSEHNFCAEIENIKKKY